MPICMLLFLLVSPLVSDWGMVPTFQETNDDDYWEAYCLGTHPARLRRATGPLH